MMSHNLRIYGTVLLLLEFAIVAMGVRFVQMLAPVSLVTVIVSILACYAGGVEKTLNPATSQYICMYGEHLLQAQVFMPQGASLNELCNYCNSSNPDLLATLSSNGWGNTSLLNCVSGYPGFASDALIRELFFD